MRPHNELEKKLGLVFSNKQLLIEALTHPSYESANSDVNNERLEFLGDATLQIVISTILFHEIADMNEGKMTKLRAKLVCEEALAVYARHLELGEYMLLGKGEESSGGRLRSSLLADAFEALIAAIYLEFGLEKVFDIVNHFAKPHFEEAKDLTRDYKTALQEALVSRIVSYHSTKTGPAHAPTFVAIVKVDDAIILGRGAGKSKKEAEQNAAKEALKKEVKHD